MNIIKDNETILTISEMVELTGHTRQYYSKMKIDFNKGKKTKYNFFDNKLIVKTTEITTLRELQLEREVNKKLEEIQKNTLQNVEELKKNIEILTYKNTEQTKFLINLDKEIKEYRNNLNFVCEFNKSLSELTTNNEEKMKIYFNEIQMNLIENKKTLSMYNEKISEIKQLNFPTKKVSELINNQIEETLMNAFIEINNTKEFNFKEIENKKIELSNLINKFKQFKIVAILVAIAFLVSISINIAFLTSKRSTGQNKDVSQIDIEAFNEYKKGSYIFLEKGLKVYKNYKDLDNYMISEYEVSGTIEVVKSYKNKKFVKVLNDKNGKLIDWYYLIEE